MTRKYRKTAASWHQPISDLTYEEMAEIARAERPHLRTSRPAWAMGLPPMSGHAEYLRRIDDYRRMVTDREASAGFRSGNEFGGVRGGNEYLAAVLDKALAGKYVRSRPKTKPAGR